MSVGITETKQESGGRSASLLSLLVTTLNAEGFRASAEIVLYTSFGVVRGRVSAAGHWGAPVEAADSVIEISEASVEHYSSHLPTAAFARFFVRLTDVQGFAVDTGGGQG